MCCYGFEEKNVPFCCSSCFLKWLCILCACQSVYIYSSVCLMRICWGWICKYVKTCDCECVLFCTFWNFEVMPFSRTVLSSGSGLLWVFLTVPRGLLHHLFLSSNTDIHNLQTSPLQCSCSLLSLPHSNLTFDILSILHVAGFQSFYIHLF